MSALFTSIEARRRFFAIGNLVPALVLGTGCSLLPVRWWLMDLTVGVAVVGLLVTSGIALFDARRADRMLRVAAFGLLAIGLALVTAFGLSAAFLAGVHGPFGAAGSLLMGLVVLLLLPYAVIYPALELLSFRERDPGAPS